MIGCERKARWEISYGQTTDDYTHACTKHVGKLLNELKTNTVYLFHERDWSGGNLCCCCYIGPVGQLLLKLKSLFGRKSS